MSSHVGRQGPCGLVANKGMRCTGNGCNLLGNVLCGSRRGRVTLQTWHSREGGGRVLEGMKIHQGDGRCS